MKKCGICKITKPFDCFGKDSRSKDGYKYLCKDCRKKEYQKNRDKNIECKRKYYQKNQEKCKQKMREYRKTDNYKKQPPRIEYHKKYRENNKEKISQYNKNYNQRQEIKRKKNKIEKHRRKNDIKYRLTKNLRCRLYCAIKNSQKTGSAIYDLGCTIEELKTHLESQFVDDMSWDNYGQWHIDHIIPLSKFDLTNRKELLKACDYTNLQPLWAKDNILKSDNIGSY